MKTGETSTQFKENHPYLKGFNAFYLNNIGPLIKEKIPARRRKDVYATRLRIVIIASSIISVWVAVSYEVPKVEGLVVPILFGHGLLAWLVPAVFFKGYDPKVEAKIITKIGEFFGFSSGSATGGVNLSNMWFTREIDGLNYRFHSPRSERVDTSEDPKKLFQGLRIKMVWPVPFKSRTEIVFLDKYGHRYERDHYNGRRVVFDDPVFISDIRIFADDPIEARTLLTESFRDLCKLLYETAPKDLKMVFHEQQIHIDYPMTTIETHYHLEYPEYDDPNLIRTALKQFIRAREITERLSESLRLTNNNQRQLER